MIRKINDSTKYLGNEPINSVANDLPSKWMALGSGYARYKTLNMLNNQPSQYGILVNYQNHQSMVAQLWFTNGGGAIYVRGGSISNDKWANGWHKFYYDNKIIIDSWNNIKKYIDTKGAFFIFDEDKICGGGAWTKAFLKITKNNDWIILSASPGDTWLDYWSVFVANGFYKNKTEFIREHVIYSRYTKYPQVERYINTQRLMRLRDKILIDMTVQRHTVPHHEDVYCNYDIQFYKEVFKKRWDPYKDEPLKQASELCYVLRKIVNSDESRQTKLLELLEDHPRAIIFYSYDYERDILMNLGYAEGTQIAEWTGHKHEPIPESEKWVYLVNYASGAEGFNCISTDTIIFYSQTYSYKTLLQSIGRIDRLDTKFIDLYYYHLKSRSGIDLAISKALKEKKQFNETRWLNSWK